jgi:hypothetical protein
LKSRVLACAGGSKDVNDGCNCEGIEGETYLIIAVHKKGGFKLIKYREEVKIHRQNPAPLRGYEVLFLSK